MRKLFILFLLCFYTSITLSEEDKVIFVKKNDRAMVLAFQKAKSKVNTFLEMAANKPEGTEHYAAYIKFEENSEVEYLWVANVQPYKDNYYIGAVISKPGIVNKVKYGETVGFQKKDIYDWQYFDKVNNKTIGSFTTCVLLKPGSPDDEAYKKEMGLECKP